jgi:hypothetical protein
MYPKSIFGSLSRIFTLFIKSIFPRVLQVIIMKCLQWLPVALVTMLKTSLVAGEGILYPTESESRVIRSLDGIWAFRLANESDSSVGHREGWYKQELRKVSVLLFVFSNYIFIHLGAC